MSLLELASIAASVILAIIAIFIFIKEERTKNLLLEEEKKHKQELIKKEDSINMIIHDLKAPLTAIKDAASLILQTPAMENDEREKLLNLAYDQSKKMFSQISTILDAAKLSAGRFTIEKVSGDLKKVIVRQVEVFLPVAKIKGIDLTTDIPDTLPRFSFDPLRISEVVTNLVSNSFKFTGKGGKIIISAKETTKNGKIFAEALVSDTGSGIPEEKQRELFSKFSQSSNPLLDGEKILEGSGLGLYIVKGIIEAHGGSISVESKADKGTTISFTLPLS